MTGPATSPDDRQPGGSEQDGVEAMTRLPVAQGSRESVDWNGGSGAGSTVIWCTRFEEPVSAGFEHHHDPCSATDHAEYVSSAALEAAQRAKVEWPDSPTWEHVMDFAEEMERKLSLHRDRGNREGWLIETPRWLFERMLREVVELGDALGYPVTIRVGRATPDGEEPGQECADVANLAMMVRDRVRCGAS
jgi:hypothetical protein